MKHHAQYNADKPHDPSSVSTFVRTYDISCFFSCLTDNRHPDALVSFIRLFKGHYHCDRLSGCRHRLSNFPDTRLTAQRWRSVGPALNGKAGEEEEGKTKPALR